VLPHPNKVFLKTSLERNSSNFLYRNSSNFSYISFLCVKFENIIVEFHVSYVLNMHIKFHSTIQSINLFFIHNFKSQIFEI